jgi:hypothetical protein
LRLAVSDAIKQDGRHEEVFRAEYLVGPRELSAKPANDRKNTNQMKTRGQWVGSLIAVSFFGAFVSVGASSAHAEATKRGWWIRVNKPKTEASTISFQIGRSVMDRQNWRRWKSGQRVEFDVPAGFRNAAEIYIRATSNPHEKKVRFCVFYRNHGVEHFEFDGDQAHHMKQDDSDDDCNP